MAGFRSFNVNSGSVAGTTGITVTKPSGVANGDVLVAFCAAGDELGGAYTCSGFTQASGTGSGAAATTVGNDIGTTVLYKYISNAAGEPADYTFTNSDTATQNRAVTLVCVQGPCNAADPIDELTQNTGTNDWTPTHVNITTGVDNAVVLFFHAGNTGTAAAKTAGAPATPSGTTLIGTGVRSRTTGNFIECESAYYLAGAAGAITVGAWTGTADDTTSEWHVYSVSIAPEANPLEMRPNNAQAARTKPELYCAAVLGAATLFSQSPVFLPAKGDVSAVHYSVGSDRARVYSENRSWVKQTPTQLIPPAAGIQPGTRFAAPQFAEDPKSKLFKALILPPPDTIGAASYAAGSMAAEHATQQPRGFVRVTPPTLIPQVEAGPNARTLVTLYQQHSDVQPQLGHPPIQYLAVVTKVAGTIVAPPSQTDQVAAGSAVVFKPSLQYLAVVTKTASTLVAAPTQFDQSASGFSKVSHPLVATTPPIDEIYRTTLVVGPSQSDQAANGSGFVSKSLILEPLSNVDAAHFTVGVDRAVVYSQNRSWVKNSPFVPAAPTVDEIYRAVRFAIPQSPELVAPQLFKTALAIPSDVIYRTTLFVAPQQQPSGYTTVLGRPALAPAAITPDEIGASAYTAGSLAREHALTQLPAFVRGVNPDLITPPAPVDEIYRTTLFVAPPQIKTGSATIHSTHPDLVPPPAPVDVIFTKPLRVGPQFGDAGFAYLFDGSVVFSDPTVKPFIAAPQRPEHRAAVLLKSSDLIPPPPPLDVIYRLTQFSAPQQLAGGAAWILGTPEFVPPLSDVDAVHFSVGSDRVRLYSENRSWIKLGGPTLIPPPAVPDVIFRSVQFTAPSQIPSGAGQILGKPVHVPALPIDTKISGTLTGGMRYEEFRRLQQPTFFDIPLEYYVPPAVVPPPVVPPPVVPPVQPAPIHPIRPAGRIVVTTKETGQVANARFDFISVIPKGDTITSAEVTAAVYSGVDPTPGAAIVALPEINRLIVTQKVQAPTVGVIYSLLCRVTTASGCVAEMSAYLTAMRKRGS